MQYPNYTPHKNRDLCIESAVTAIKALVTLQLIPKHKKELLSICIWKITEADGKYATRYRSLKSISATKKELRHEHVIERAKLVEKILKNSERIDHVIKDAVACVVTMDEHQKLTEVSRRNPALEGWLRYAEAGITVLDLQEKKELHF